MRIGFDAKRAYQNGTGLGNFSRFLLSHLQQTPEVEVLAYTPKVKPRFQDFSKQVEPQLPKGKTKGSFWRSYGINKDLVQDDVQIFHGLSNEIPFGLPKKIKSVVTIHDLIFLRFPEFYKPIDRWVYKKKFSYAAKNSDKILAISQQTKEDIVSYLRVDLTKVDVFYQDCAPHFHLNGTEGFSSLKEKYNLPDDYLLCVGTIESRKNQLEILKALHFGKIDLPLVLIGKKTTYFKEIESFISAQGISKNQLIHLQNIPNEDLPGLYQNARVFIYPSLFEGFGIPILEALNAGVPVVTSSGSCFSEVGGKAAKYALPGDTDALIDAIQFQLSETNRAQAIAEGHIQKMKFRIENTLPSLLETYKSLL